MQVMQHPLTRSITAGLAMLAAVACNRTETGPVAAVAAQPAEVRGGQPVSAPTTLAYNRTARALVKKYATGAAPAMRVYALTSVVQYRAATDAEASRGRHHRVATRAAIAAASTVMLGYLYSAETAALEATLDSMRTGAGARQAEFAAGEAIGRSVAAAEVERAKVDGFFKPFTGTVPVCDGCWRAVPTPPAFATLGAARTFFLASGDQFRPAPPPAWGSPAFLADLAEVRQVSDTRTPEQDSIAKFWSLQGGTVTPLGHWNIVADELISARPMGERAAAHVLALVNTAGYDALVASHEAKYTYWLIRPSQADPGITLPIALPSFPSYPSNHAAISSAAATVLGAIFPRHRDRLAADAEEAGISRIYGGIHYRFDSDAGIELGRKVATWVLKQDRRGTGPLR